MKFKTKILSFILPLTLGVTSCFGMNVQTVQAKETSETDENYYSFNPHVCSTDFYNAYGEEYWTSFFNLCDALRNGEDTFECASREVYIWCMVGGPLDSLFPAARYRLEYLGADAGYCNGVGKIAYAIPQKEFVEREDVFETIVESIIRDNIREDDTDFEKCAALYKYIADNYIYDKEEEAANKAGKINDFDNGIYRTLMEKKGICKDLSGLYTYLLLQCGVDACNFRDENLEHCWSYVKVDGIGYHVDPTWFYTLDYFMTPDSIRKQHLENSGLSGSFAPVYFYDDEPLEKADFTADDDRYAELRKGMNILEIDRERKVMILVTSGQDS